MAKVSDLEWILGRLDAILTSSSDKDVTRNREKIQQITKLVAECKEEIGIA
jgi:hypothetical protein